ncbi:LrgB family protein [Bacillus sp. 03113]|uniref:LrgB family protein n=1 Tax=Bacillus sp. 03113 TaxID=2578211 RepID=UPI0011416B40|nr:LrgB family protein [Bacillus sp. 03113]
MEQLLKAAIIIVINVMIFLLMRKVYQKFHLAILNSVITTTMIIILFMLIFRIPYETYMLGGNWINSLLGPAVISFAFPLYLHRKLLLKYLLPIILGVTVATFVGMISGVLIMNLFGIEKEFVLSMIPKALTIPVAVQVANTLGGMGLITAVFTMFAGYSGIIFGPIILRVFRIHSEIGIGVGLGSASQAVGVAKALEHSELSGSVGSVSMALTAVVGSLIAPFIPIIFGL